MNFYLLYLLITISGAMAIFVYLWTHRKTRGSLPLAIVCVTAVFWMLGELIVVVSSTFAGQFSGEIIKFSGIISLPVALVTFVRRYCGKQFSAKHIAIFSVVPIISFFVLITSTEHSLFFTDLSLNHPDLTPANKFGSYFWLVHTPYSYILIIGCLGILLFEMNRVSQRFRTQMIILFVAILIPVLLNVLNLSSIVSNVSTNPFGFLCFLILSTIGIFRFQLFRGSPIAYEAVFNTTRDGVVILNPDSIIMDINPSLASELKKSRSELIGRNVNSVFAEWKPFASKYEDHLEIFPEFDLELDGVQKYFSVSFKPINESEGEVSGLIMTIRDITALKLHQISLETLVFIDPLTMLANRRKFEDEFRNAVKIAEKMGKRFAVLYFDLNRFKAVNDNLGHKIGDELLKHVAARIASILRAPDIVARLGGDEFAAILHNATESGVNIAVDRILENTRTPFRVKGQTIIADLSVGAAFYPNHGEDLLKLLNHADIAMFRAKSYGGGLAVFDTSLDSPKILSM